MIVKEFNAGWGDNFALRQFEKSLCDTYLRDVYADASTAVMINSTWYGQQYHQEVLEELEKIQPDRIILLSMVDPAIPRPDWYDAPEVWGLGYYPGPHHIDAWSLIVHKHFDADPSHDSSRIDLPFMCLNRKPHWHRRRLYQALGNHDLLHKGIVTMGDDSGQAIMNLDNDVEGSDLAPNPGPEQYGIVNDIMTLGPAELWNRCFLNVVTETVFDIKKDFFVSEKIYKPIVGLRPFVVYASDGGQSWFDRIGIESYRHDFLDISNADPARPDQIPQLLVDLTKQPVNYFQHKYLALRNKIMHNKAMFDVHVQQTWTHVNRGALCQT